MDDRDYVETSDPEELEVIQGLRDALLSPSRGTARPSTRPGPVPLPRKRRKLLHDANDDGNISEEATLASRQAIVQDIDDGLTTPIRSSPGLPTSTAISDDERYDPTLSTADKKVDSRGEEEDEGSLFNTFPQVLRNDPMDLAFDVYDVGSQDELDFISSPVKQVVAFPADGGLPIRVRGPSRHQSFHTGGSASPARDLRVSVSLHSRQQADNGNAELVGSPSDSSLLHSPRTFAVNSRRHASLPPSSPPRTSSPTVGTPLRSFSLSPERVVTQPPSQAYEQDDGARQIPSEHNEVTLQLANDDDDDGTTRRYSLRTRQARQLNPYEYDKRLYKQQMRRLPDAIVKVVSPRRHHSGRTHKRHDGEDEDFVIPDDDIGESQLLLGESQGHRRRSDALQEDDGFPRKDLTWLPKAFHMSDEEKDDLTPLLLPAARQSPLELASEDLHERHKSRHKRLHRFPLKEARARKADDIKLSQKDEKEKAQNRPRSSLKDARLKDTKSASINHSGRSNSQPARHFQSELDHPSPISSSEALRRNPVELARSRGGSEVQEHDHGLRNEDETAAASNGGGSNLHNDDIFNDGNWHDDNLFFSNDPDIALQDDRSQKSHSDTESLASSDFQVRTGKELSKRDRKRMRHLRRMVPAVMISRLQGQGVTALKRTVRSRSVSTSATAESNSETDEDVVLVPGRSRITKRLNAPRAEEIKGDSESSEPEIGGVVKMGPENMIDVEPSSDSDESESSSSSSETVDTLEKTIADAGYFDHDFTRRPMRRKEEPLIDMMLSRTRTKRAIRRENTKRPKARASARAPGHGLKSDALDVNIRKPPHHSRVHINRRSGNKQERLPFKPASNSSNQFARDEMIDLTNLDPLDVDDGPGVDQTGQSMRPLTSKQRREVARKATLHTFINDGRKITGGRKKGFMKVQIDMADDCLRQALKPLRSDSPLKTTPRSNFASADTGRRQIFHHGWQNISDRAALKQTSLHDFAADDEPPMSDLEPRTAAIFRTGSSAAAEWYDADRIRTCTFNMGISAPALGLAFGALTYLGKQFLPDLLDTVSTNSTATRPSPYSGFGLIDLDAEMSAARFVEAIEVASNLLFEWLDEETAELTDPDNVRRYEHLMHSISRFASWIASCSDHEGWRCVQTATSICANQLMEKVRGRMGKPPAIAHHLDIRYLAVMWFIVEMMARILPLARRRGSELDITYWSEALLLLTKILIKHGIGNALKPIEKRDMESPSTSLRAAELWICLIHLLPRTTWSPRNDGDVNGTFWPVILQAVKVDDMFSMSNIEFSEHIWRLIFGLSALSHFTIHGIATDKPRLSPCWDIVGLALDTIRLTHDKGEDSKVPRESLKRRDRYVRMVVARCFLLGTKWKWPLNDSYVMFKKLVDIFKSRNFANLLGEGAEYPAFLRYHSAEHLDELRTSDTAFSVYLKLVMQAAKSDSSGPGSEARAKSKVMKLLSLAVPLSGVMFSKARPPTSDELPMLINRFSAIVVAILVDGKDNANIRSRVSQARRYINFAEADERSRDICIKAAMYITIATSHLSLEIDEPLTWLGEMCQTLLGEFLAINAELRSKDMDAHKVDGSQRLRNRLVISLHLLLRCIRNVIEKPDMERYNEYSCPRYPNRGLLSGPWVKRVFPMKDLTNMVSTRVQILLLVQSFLNTRAKVIPPPRRSAPSTILEDSSESQDLFMEFGMDDDILALLPMDGETDVSWEKDKEVAEIMNSDIVPHIFRLLLQYFNDPSSSPSDVNRLEEYWSSADEWIDCWVGCAAVVVRHEIRDWGHYLNVGPQSWAGISDSFFRRRVALRFMYQLLQCDPTAYNKDHERHFLVVFLQSLVTFRATMENEYLSTLFSIDGLRHVMLRDIPLGKDQGLQLNRASFLEVRGDIITRVFSNLDSFLEIEGSERDKSVYVECVVEMLSAMQDIWKNLASTDDQNKYGDLCRHVFSNIRKHVRVKGLQRLAPYMTWGATFGIETK